MSESLRAHWRSELSYVGLALMECCWLYPWVSAIIGRRAGSSDLPFAALVFTLLVALYATRFLQRRTASLWLQRLLTILLAVLCTLLLVRLYVYEDYRPGDWSWLLRFVTDVAGILEYMPRGMLVCGLGLYLWWRGISLAQRELGFDSAALSFRIGILAFLWLPVAGMFGASVEATRFAFAYFGLALIVMGVVRVRDVSESMVGIRSPFDVSWLAILAGAALLVMLLSVVTVRLLSVRTVAMLLVWLGPLWRFLGVLLTPVAALLARLLQLVFAALAAVFSRLLGSSGQGQSAVDRVVQRLLALQPNWQAAGRAPLLLQVLQWVVLVLFLVGVLTILAFSIGRRRRQHSGARTAQYEALSGTQDDDQSDAGGWLAQLRGLESLLGSLSRWRGQGNAVLTIRQVYARLAGLAAEMGSPRRVAQTPYEYVKDLQRVFPENIAEVHLITEAYVAAHYGQVRFPSEYLLRVKEAWLAIRQRHPQGRIVYTNARVESTHVADSRR